MWIKEVNKINKKNCHIYCCKMLHINSCNKNKNMTIRLQWKHITSAREKKAKHHFPFIFLYTFSFYSLFGYKWIFFSYNYVQQQQERKFLLDTGSSHKNLSFFTFQTVLFIIPLFFLIFLLFFLLFLRWALYILNCVFKKKITVKDRKNAVKENGTIL